MASYAPDFRIVANVSAAWGTTRDGLQIKMGQTIRQGVVRNETEGEMPTYLLVVTDAPVETDPAYRDIYRSAARGARGKGDLRVLPIRGIDFADAFLQLAEQARPRGLEFDNMTLAGAFDRICAGLGGEGTRMRAGWSRDTLIECLSAGTA